MTLHLINDTDLHHVHQALCIPMPLGQLSPVVVMMLTTVACHWKNKTSATFDDPNAHQLIADSNKRNN